MKISKQSYRELEDAILPHLPAIRYAPAITKRQRWDALWASGFNVSKLYDEEGLNDDHIDTALRKIVGQ